MTSTAAVLGASALASASAWLLSAPRAQLRWRLPSLSVESDSFRPRSRLLIGVAVVGPLVVELLRTYGVRIAVLAAAAGGVAYAARSLWSSYRRREVAAQRRAAVMELCDALAAELAAGLPATTAIERACAAWPEVKQLATFARLGDDVAAALRQYGRELQGAHGLMAVAAGWDVAARSGAALSEVLARVGAGLRSDEEARAEVTASLGPPRATAKLLAMLPLFGLALGMSMGADPLGFLLGTGAGLACLTVGVALALAGMWWVERLASATEV